MHTYRMIVPLLGCTIETSNDRPSLICLKISQSIFSRASMVSRGSQALAQRSIKVVSTKNEIDESDLRDPSGLHRCEE
jgi:hypothetical protein